MNIEDLAKPIPRDQHVKTVNQLEEAKRALYVTLLDQFAMAALTGILANPDSDKSPAGAVIDAYDYADCMMDERKDHKQI